MSKKCLYTSLISITILFLLLTVGALILFTHIDYFIDEQVKKVSLKRVLVSIFGVSNQ